MLAISIPEEEVADEGHVREAMKGRPPGLAARHADGGVAENGSMDPLPVARRDHGDDRPAPILAGDGEVAQIEGPNQ